jgi:hypothetical protein
VVCLNQRHRLPRRACRRLEVKPFGADELFHGVFEDERRCVDQVAGSEIIYEADLRVCRVLRAVVGVPGSRFFWGILVFLL